MVQGLRRSGATSLLLPLLALLPPGAAPPPPPAPPPPAADPVVLQDFGDPSSAGAVEAWNVKATRTAEGALLLEEFRPSPETDSVLRIRFEARDFRPLQAVSFRISVPKPPMELAVSLLAAGGSRRHGTRLRLEEAGDREVILPLTHLDSEWGGLLATYDSVDALELRWSSPPGGAVALDDLRGVPGTRGGNSWYPSDEQWLAWAFPEGGGKAAAGKNFILYTDLPEYQGSKASRILGELDGAVALASGRMRLPKPDVPRLPFFLFRDAARADAFGARLGQARRGTPRATGGTGFAAFSGVGTAIVAQGQAPYFPHIIHIALHPWLARSLGSRTASEWVQEAIIGMVGWKLNADAWVKDPQHFRKVEAATFRRRMQGESTNLLPLAELLKPENEKPENLIEFATLGEYLATCHRASLPKVWEALRSLDSSDAVERLGAVARALGTTPEGFEADWVRWGASNWK